MANAKIYLMPQELRRPSHFSYIAAPPQPAKWEEVYEYLTNYDFCGSDTEILRALLEQNKTELYTGRKKYLKAFTPAAFFEGKRDAKHLQGLTGVALCDFDGIEGDKLAACVAKVQADEHTFMQYVTTSGKGLRVLFRYTTDEKEVCYLDAWRMGNQYYSALLGLDYDVSCSDPTRLSFYAWDPKALYRPGAVPFYLPIGPDKRLRTDNFQKEIDLTATNEHPYSQAGGEQLKLFNLAEAYMLKQMQTLPPTDRLKWEEGSRHAYLIQLCMFCNCVGLPEGAAREFLTEKSPRGAYPARRAEADGIVNWIYSKYTSYHGSWRFPRVGKAAAEGGASDCERDEAPARERNPRSSIKRVEQIREYLQSNYDLRYNEISDNIEYSPKGQEHYVVLNDYDQNSIWLEISKQMQYVVPSQILNDCIRSNTIKRYNAIDEYLSGLPKEPEFEEGGEDDYICQIARRVHTTNPRLFELCFKKWFVSMIACWVDHEVTNQTILTLIGPQGIFKSTFFRLLLPPVLRPYFLVKGNSSKLTKDDLIAVTTFALIDCEEIDTIKDSELNALKSLLTTQVVTERAAYARNRNPRPHLASFCATGNNKNFLTDMTGNRRWLPFYATAIENPYTTPIDYDKLYAQGLALYLGGYQYWFSHKEDTEMEDYKADFSTPNVAEEYILHSFRPPYEGELGQFYSTAEIQRAIALDSRITLAPRDIARALDKLGVKRERHKLPQGNVRGYVLISLSPAESDAEGRAAALQVRSENQDNNH